MNDKHALPINVVGDAFDWDPNIRRKYLLTDANRAEEISFRGL